MSNYSVPSYYVQNPFQISFADGIFALPAYDFLTVSAASAQTY